MSQPLPTYEDVLAAAARIRGEARHTPLERSRSLSNAAGQEVFLKLENLQRTGSFKFRGALSALSSIHRRGDGRAVVTASAGNHGLGLALAARLLGVAATIFVPNSTPFAKRNRLQHWADLRIVDGGYDAAHAEAVRFAREEGAVYIHAFSDPEVVAGQGSVGLEIFEDLPDAETLLVPVGGGGLIGGIGLVARAIRPGAQVVGVQSELTSAMHDSLKAGALRSPPAPPTLCEGLSGDIDARSLALAQTVVDDMVMVPDGAVREAIRRLHLEEDVIAEGSGAVAAAALWEKLIPGLRGPVAVVVTGGNIDSDVFGELTAIS